MEIYIWTFKDFVVGQGVGGANVADEAMLRAMLWRRPYFYDAWQLLTRIEEVLDLTFLKLCVI